MTEFFFPLTSGPPSPVLLLPKGAEKSTERLRKGTKSNKDLRRYMPLLAKVTVMHASPLQCFHVFMLVFLHVLLGQSENNLV